MFDVLKVSRLHQLHWGAGALWAQLEPLLPGLTVEVVARCGSTNTELLERLRTTAPGRYTDSGQDARPSGRRLVDSKPRLLIAEHQTSGRGRMGRVWRSSPGASLTFSLALPLASAHGSGLSLAVGVALAQALQPSPSASKLTIGLKWPNDLWLVHSDWRSTLTSYGSVGGRKLGGVLIETLAVGGQRFAVVGIGLNVTPLPGRMTAELRQGVACLQELDPDANGPAVLGRIALPVLQALQSFERDGFSAFAPDYAARDVLLDQKVTTTQAGVPHGIARGVTAPGTLLVETTDGLHAINSGDVSVRLDTVPDATAAMLR